MSSVAALLGLLGIYFPPLSIVTNLVWLVPLIIITMRWDIKRGLMSLLISGLLMGVLSSPVDALLLLVEYGGLALVYGYSFQKMHKLEKTLLRGILTAALGSILMIALSIGILGFNPSDLLAEMQNASMSTVSFYEETGMMARFEEQGISREQVMDIAERVGATMVLILPSIMVVLAMITAIVSLMVTRGVLSRLKIPVPQKLPPFREWKLDFRFVYGFIAGLLAFLAGDYWQLSMLSTLGINLLVAFGFIFSLQGLAVLISLFTGFKAKPFVRIFMVALLVLYAQVMIYLLLFVGLFDEFFDYRKRLRKKGDKDEGHSE